MYALFEEAGKFLSGRILSEAESSAQIELESGKRVKAKSAHILFKFEKPSPTELISQAQTLAQTIELELAWEFAPEDEFGFADLAREYFNAQASLVEQAAALFRLYEAPHYFRRAGKGRFKKAPAEIIQQALAAIEKKKQIQLQIEAWASELAQGTCPQPVLSQLYKILFKPDKNGPEYKAVVEAAKGPGRSARLTNFIGSVFCSSFFPKARLSPNSRLLRLPRVCRWHLYRLIRLTIRKPPRLTMRCQCKAWAAARSRWAFTSPHRAWPSCPAVPWMP